MFPTNPAFAFQAPPAMGGPLQAVKLVPGFRAPGLPGGGGGGIGQAPGLGNAMQQQGQAGQSMQGLAAAMARLPPTAAGPQGSGVGGAYTQADATAMANAANGTSNGVALAPGNPSFGDLGMGSGAGGDGGFMAWLSSLGSSLGLSGAGSGAGAAGGAAASGGADAIMGLI